MGLFFDSKRGLTRDEYKKRVRGILRGKHFSDDDLDDVDTALEGYFSEEGGRSLVEPSEAKELVAWFRKNKSKHNLSDEQITALESTLAPFL